MPECWVLLDLYETLGSRNSRRHSRSRPLRYPPRIEDRYLVHTRDRAVRGAAFFGQILAAQIFAAIFLQWNPWIATLLRAVMHQPVLADIEVACSGAAAPIVGHALGDVVLKCVDPGEAALLERLHLVINASLFVTERLQLPAAIVNDPNRRCEAQFDRTLADYKRVLRMWNPSAHHGVDVHMKVGILG